MNYKLIILYGFHFSYAFIFSLAVIRDIIMQLGFNGFINASAVITTVISYYLLHFKHKQKTATILTLLVAVVPLYTLIYFNPMINLVIIYVMLLPLATFFLFKFKLAIQINSLIYISFFALLYAIYLNHPDDIILNNLKALINISFASILITSFGFLYHLSIESTLNALIASNKQKDLLLKEVHHRVKNNLNITASILGLQTKGKDEITKDELLKSKTRIEAIALVHEMLYKHDNFEQIPFNEYILKIKALLISIIKEKQNVSIDILNNNNITLSLDKMIQFGLIINELLTNSIKHNLECENLKIIISLQKDNNKYKFFYTDSGSSKVTSEVLHTENSLGIRLIKLSAKQLDASLEIIHNEQNGLTYRLEFLEEAVAKIEAQT